MANVWQAMAMEAPTQGEKKSKRKTYPNPNPNLSGGFLGSNHGVPCPKYLKEKEKKRTWYEHTHTHRHTPFLELYISTRIVKEPSKHPHKSESKTDYCS